MRQANCYIPIKLCITGRPTDAQLDELSETIVRALEARIAFAERAIESHSGGRHLPGDGELVREDYDPAREDVGNGGYSIPSYGGGGQPVNAKLQRRRPRQPWFVRTSIQIKIRVRDLIDFLEPLDPKNPVAGEYRSTYYDFLDEIRTATVWLVVARTSVLVEPLVVLVKDRYETFVPGDKDYIYGYSVREESRLRLIALEQGTKLARLPSLSLNPGGYTQDGQIFLRRDGMMLFIGMVLPKVQVDRLINFAEHIKVSLPLRDLDFIVDPDSFERLFGVSWKSYIHEFGSDLADLHIKPFFTLRRAHFTTLKFLVEQRVEATVDERSAYFGNLYLLNQSRLDWLPAAARTAAAEFSDSETRKLDESKRLGYWEKDWDGAFVYAVLSPTSYKLDAARLLPEARELADEIIKFLKGDPDELAWPFKFHTLLRSVRAEVFEYTLIELHERGWLDRLFEAVEQANNWDLHHLLLQLTLATAYSAHNRVTQSVELINARRRSSLNNSYKLTEQEIWIDKDSDYRVSVGDIIADVHSIYSVEKDVQRIKEARLAELKVAAEEEAKALMGRLARGEDKTQYDEEGFTKAVLEAALKRVNLGESDVEEVTIERSIRLLGIEMRLEAAIERNYITYEYVERVDEGPWQTVPDSRRTRSDAAVEEMLLFWSIAKQAVVIEAFAIGVTSLALLVIAWEIGAIAVLVKIAGGATAVILSITVSELIYLLKVIFGNSKLTLRGFLMAALDGYLMALTFRGAGFIGRGLAAKIGTDSLRKLIGGWVVERLTVGVLGGAGSAALTTFCHDLLGVLSGGTWSSPEDYVKSMMWGACLGVVFEFGIGALQPILRASGRNALETLEQVVERVRAEGITVPRWSALTAEALGNFRQKLAQMLEEGMAKRFTAAFRSRISEISERLLTAEGRRAMWSEAVARRVLELSEIGLTRSAAQGLEKLMASTAGQLDDQATLSLFNTLKAKPGQANLFLEGIGAIDDTVVQQLGRSGQLEAIAVAPELLHAIRYDPVIAKMISGTAQLSATQATARVRGILAVARTRPMVPESITPGELFAKGGTSEVYKVEGRADLLAKRGGGRLPREAESLVELEMMGIETVYAGTRRVGGQTYIALRKIEGVGSKDIIGRVNRPLKPAQNIEVITQKTIDDLERIYDVLKKNNANVGDFQFIVRKSDGAVFMNDPVSFNIARGPSGTIRNIIDRFKSILRKKSEGGAE